MWWHQVVLSEKPARVRYGILANILQTKEVLNSQPRTCGDTTGPQEYVTLTLERCQESVILLTSPSLSLLLSDCRSASYLPQTSFTPPNFSSWREIGSYVMASSKSPGGLGGSAWAEVCLRAEWQHSCSRGNLSMGRKGEGAAY